jgi:hypothetical protein
MNGARIMKPNLNSLNRPSSQVGINFDLKLWHLLRGVQLLEASQAGYRILLCFIKF